MWNKMTNEVIPSLFTDYCRIISNAASYIRIYIYICIIVYKANILKRETHCKSIKYYIHMYKYIYIYIFKVFLVW